MAGRSSGRSDASPGRQPARPAGSCNPRGANARIGERRAACEGRHADAGYPKGPCCARGDVARDAIGRRRGVGRRTRHVGDGQHERGGVAASSSGRRGTARRRPLPARRHETPRMGRRLGPAAGIPARGALPRAEQQVRPEGGSDRRSSGPPGPTHKASPMRRSTSEAHPRCCAPGSITTCIEDRRSSARTRRSPARTSDRSHDASRRCGVAAASSSRFAKSSVPDWTANSKYNAWRTVQDDGRFDSGAAPASRLRLRTASRRALSDVRHVGRCP